MVTYLGENIKMEQGKIFECSLADDISKCVALIKKGGVIVFPTDTVYAIGCDPYSQLAVNRVFVIKNRKTSNPLPVLASTIEDIKNIAFLDSRARVLAKKYWPGPLTLVCPLLDPRISSLVVSSIRTVAVRIPSNKCTLELLRGCRYLAGTSANISGQASARDVHQIVSSSLKGFDAMLDGGHIVDGRESTIVDLSKQGSFSIVREGAIKSENIREILSRGSDSSRHLI
jgi:L-threonylcarbamoyladenylate synthase